MDIEEINKIPNFDLPNFELPDNLKTSDELETHSTDYLEYGKTFYARNKKIKKASKTIGIISSFSAIGILTGTFIFSSSNILSNTFIGKTPTLKKLPTFLMINNSLYYSINLENNGNLSSYLVIKNNENNKEDKIDISKTDNYLNKLSNLLSTNYTISSLVTNSNDYNNETLLFKKFDINITNDQYIKKIYSKIKYSFYLNNFDKNYNSYIEIYTDNNIVNKIEINDNYLSGEINIDSNLNYFVNIIVEKENSEDKVVLYSNEL